MRMHLILPFLTALFCFQYVQAQFIVEQMPREKSSITPVVLGDTVLLIGGDESRIVDFFDVNSGFYAEQEYGSDAFTSAKAFSTDETVFVYDLSGVNLAIREFYKYDLASNTWSDGKYASPIDEDIIFQVGDQAYSFRRTDTENVWILDLNTGTVQSEPSPFEERRFGIISDGNFVYCAGGRTASGASDQLAIFNKENKEWTYRTLTGARERPNLALGENKLFIFGGINSFSRDLEIYDLTADTSTIVEFPVRNNDATLHYVNGKVIMAAGDRNDAYVLDLDTLGIGEPYVFADQFNFGIDDIQAINSGTTAIFAGADDGGVFLFESETGTWAALTDISARTDVALFRGNNNVYLAGGELEDDSNTDELIIFQFSTSIKELAEYDFTVYPNPSNGMFFVESEESVEEFVVYSSTGQIVLKGIGKEINLQSSGFSSSFFVRIKFSNGNVVFSKLVKVLH